MRTLFTLLLIALFSLQALAAEPFRSKQHANLTMITDEQMLLPLAQLAREYAKKTNTPLTVVLKNTDDIGNQIEQGLEAHLILTANKPLLERLSAQGLTDVSSRTSIARTQLALVTASTLSKQANLAKRISFAAMLSATPDLPVFTSDIQSYEGERVHNLLTGHAFSADLAARLDNKPSIEDTLLALRDNEGLALILTTDAATEPDIKVLAVLPDDLSPPIVFEAVLLGGEAMSEAKGLLTYLRSPDAQKIFASFGFQTANAL